VVGLEKPETMFLELLGSTFCKGRKRSSTNSLNLAIEGEIERGFDAWLEIWDCLPLLNHM
jgi:hypothetical protein